MKLPEWVNWLARDSDEALRAHKEEPRKRTCGWVSEFSRLGLVEETDDTFKHIKWTDEEPTKIKRGLEAGGVSVKELNRITNTKAHGYDKVPTMEKSKVYNGKTIPENANENDILFEKGTIDGKQVTIMKLHNGTTFEPIGSADTDIINEPNHYKGKHGIETIDVIRNFGNDDMVAGFYWGNAIKYMTRYRSKNGLEDLKKARKNLDWLIEHTEG